MDASDPQVEQRDTAGYASDDDIGDHEEQHRSEHVRPLTEETNG